jgi:Ty3 transposon capsid-like protein/Zinc knuckle
MSQSLLDPVYPSPTSSSAETSNIPDEADAQVLTGTLTKERLRDIALSKLAELRADKAALQRDKDNAILQIAELRMMVHGRNQDNPVTSPPYPQQATLPNVRRLQPKPALPEKFNGMDKAQLITNWLFAVRLYLRVTRTDVEDYVMMATTFFAGTALDWWRGVERVEGEGIYSWSWTTFSERCIKRFQASNESQLAFQRLIRWKQTGHITSYLSVFQALVQQIPLTLLTEQGRVFMFIEGLNQELQKAVRLMQPNTVDEAISIAQRASATSTTPTPPYQSFNRPTYRQPSNPVRSNSQFNRSTTGNRFAPLMLENMEEEATDRLFDPPPSCNERRRLADLETSYLNTEERRLYKENKCFRCKKRGHISKECRSNSEAPTKE